MCVKKEDINLLLFVIYEGVNSVLYCSVKCFIDFLCDGFSFDVNSKYCFGVYGFESEGYFY